MNEEVLNLSIRRFLKHFGVTAQREIERAVNDAIRAGKLTGSETLTARARLELDGLAVGATIEGEITLS